MASAFALFACLTGIAQVSPAAAQSNATQTAAGTPITNVASMRYTVNGQDQGLDSNEATLIVAERLDVRLTRPTQGTVAIRTDPTPVPVDLVNPGNGNESFVVSAMATAGVVSIQAIAIDVDGDGLYDPARDTLLDGGVTPALAPGATLKLLVLLTEADVSARGSFRVTARAATGSGQPGTTYAGQGDGGGDAVVGTTGATATLDIPFDAAVTGPTLVKSQSVLANDGSSTPFRDSIITYTLEARFVSALDSAQVDDPIPAGTTYVAGSLTLDGAVLSDAADSDAGSFDGAKIGVALANVAAGSAHIIQFKTKIQ